MKRNIFAFLNRWLYKFVFCIGLSIVAKEYDNLPISLGSAKRFLRLLSYYFIYTEAIQAQLPEEFVLQRGPSRFHNSCYSLTFRIIDLCLKIKRTVQLQGLPQLKTSYNRTAYENSLSSPISPSQFTPYSPGWMKFAGHIPYNNLSLEDI